MGKFLAVLVFLATLLSVLNPVYTEQCESCIDLTRTADSTGTPVVLATIDVLSQTGIFPDDSDFLRRVAYLVSQDGNASISGGIWGITESVFINTVANVDDFTFTAISNGLGIEWDQVQSSDLSMPLYSALALKIYLGIAYVEVDYESLNEQATIWEELYGDYGDAAFYTASIGSIEVCNTTGK